ncbi:alpha/beta fold hydrolase [Pengzhenrongella frigida]|uniref:Alpha/beta fold hydrolase n=1 Tax=Pengzhenrongella frigida TaxID=1259133 RepID=A0A4Q5N5B7_9MICO|nr:alpha/beta fold hydrolase [Cellulomonas sp. HLT2-17]RYV51281.1 alpha/beta fold hydrolase [Cellulomonas sp. HLT2-17]
MTLVTRGAAFRHRFGGVLAATAAGAALGLVLGLAMPRGPMNSLQSLSALTLAVGTGVVAGRAWRTRWAALLTPATCAAVFEVTRSGAPGPSVGAIRLESLYGVAVFVAGRGFDALVIGAPMVVGAFWGAALARRQPAGRASPAHTRAATAVRRAALGLASVGVLVIVVGLARPAGTEAILGSDGEPVPGSVAELVSVPIGGHDQVIMLRGNDVGAPVLLFLEGGPGGTALGAMRYSGQGLEEHFVVATWDQRGTGKSAVARDPVDTLTVDQAVSDTIEVSEYLRDRFRAARIYVVGSSWGTTLGVLAVAQRPDLFQAYVGTGQMVDQQETDTLMYADSVAYAERVGDDRFADQLADIGPPPYTDPLAYPLALSSNPDWDAYPRGADYDNRGAYPTSLFVAEYTLTEQVRATAALADTFAALYPQLQDIDFRRDVPQLAVPVYLVEGAHEAPGRAVLAQTSP